MKPDLILPTLLLLLGFLGSAWLVWSLFDRPKSFWKVYDRQMDARPDLRDHTGYQGWVFFLPFVLLGVFGCGLCWLGYEWVTTLMR